MMMNQESNLLSIVAIGLIRKSGYVCMYVTDRTQDFYTHAFYVNEGATVTFMGKFRASKVPSAFWNKGYTE